MHEFEEYLAEKKIDSGAFKQSEPEMWADWQRLFSEVHPKNFAQQKLFLINPTRRKYPLKEKATSLSAKSAQAKPKPKFKIPPRPKKKD